MSKTGLAPTKRKKVAIGRANQWIAPEQQREFLRNCFRPESDTYLDVKKSAIAAGFSEKYATVLRSRFHNGELNWLSKGVNVSKEGILFNLQDLTRETTNVDVKRKLWNDIADLLGYKVTKLDIEQRSVEIKLDLSNIPEAKG